MNAIAQRRVAGATALMIMLYLLQAVLFAPPAQADHASCHGSEKYSEFTFNFVNGTTISGDNCPGSPYAFEDNGNHKVNEAWFEGTGGAAAFPNGPGMQIHVSCSEVFTDGWANNGGQPDENVDTNWKIADYSIVKYSANGQENNSCLEVFVTTTTTQPTTTTTEPTTTTTEGTTTTTEGPRSFIVVKKIVLQGDQSLNFDFDGAFGNGLAHGQDSGLIPVDPGEHTVTEDLSSPLYDGYETPSIQCDDGNSTGVGATATYRVEAGETVTCVFTNNLADTTTTTTQPTTTTTTQPTTTTTTQPTTTTTTQPTTTTTQPETTTTRPETTTTTTGPGEANVIFSVACDDNGDFVAAFSLPGASGRLDIDGDGVYGPGDTDLGSGTYVLTGETYMWDATADAGNVFPPTVVISGSGDVDSCVEVLGTTVTTIPEVVADTLPFTGFETEETLRLGLLALLAGALLLFATRGTKGEEDSGLTVVSTGGWTNG